MKNYQWKMQNVHLKKETGYEEANGSGCRGVLELSWANYRE
jgi:hypothetical protein